MEKKKHEFEGIAKILNRVVPDFKQQNPSCTDQILNEWKTLIGSPVSDHTKPFRLKNDTLYLYVDSTVWFHEINNFCKNQLIETLQTKWPQIKKIRLKTGVISN